MVKQLEDVKLWEAFEAIDCFAEFMKAKLRMAMKKGDNRSSTPWIYEKQYLEARLREEYKEYLSAHNEHELIDVANFCCFIWWKYMLNGLRTDVK